MLCFKLVDKRFANKIIFSQFSYHFNLPRYCIAGKNGIGKTTMLLMGAGLETADRGDISFNQQNVFVVNTKKNIGVSSDKILLPAFLSAQQLINFHCQQHQIDFPEHLLSSLNFSTQLRNKVSELSLGNSKKLSLILALAHQPQCLLIDEPSTGLDHTSREWLLDYLHHYTRNNMSSNSSNANNAALSTDKNNTQKQIIVTSHEDDFINDTDYCQLNFAELTKSSIKTDKV